MKIFVDIVGSENVRDANALDAICGVRPQWVVEPADEQQVAQVLRAANAAGLAVVPRGGGTKLDWGNPPARADVVLSTTRMNRVLDHPWADLTVTVEAGCSIGALQRQLRQHGQHVAVDPLWPDQATVGGVLATNDSGALRLRFGGLRDLIIGATIALADGTLAMSGGKVVKNVAGYDLPKLMTGAFGTLGVITRAVFRLHPLPQHAQTWTLTAETIADAQKVIESIQDSRMAHTSLQLRATSESRPSVDVRFEGSEAGMAAQVRALTGFQGPSGAEIWQAREGLWEPPGAILKLSVLMTDIAAVLNVLRDESSAPWRAVMYATGLGWCHLDPSETSARTIDRVRAFAEQRGGSLVVVRPLPIPDRIDAWGRTGDAQPLMAALKQQFDPLGTLNPGRFAGGI